MDVRARPALRAVVTGAAGQDGSYLVERLRERGYDVLGIDRGDVDLLDSAAVREMLRDAAPREVYNLASPSFVPRSWEEPVEVAQLGAVGVTVLLEAIRELDPAIRFLQASSAEVFGVPAETPQSESTPFRPVSPYGAAKAYGTFTHRGVPEQATGCTRAPRSCSTTSRRDGRPSSCPRRSRAALRRSRRDAQQRARARRPRRRARLGLRAGLRRGDVADAAAGLAGRLRHRHRRGAQRA